MKPVLLLSVLLCAAFAAPVEEEVKPEETAEEVQGEIVLPGPGSRFNFCPEGWFMYENLCYKYFNFAKTWFDAEEHCKNAGAHLPSVVNPRQYRFLQDVSQTARQTTLWLGGFHLQGRWLWINRHGFYYGYWYQIFNPSSNPCLFLNSDDGWSNGPCTSKRRFACAKNAFGC
ncbi:struthiocalcin-1-like [Anableps anableps]